jgi:cell division protease FtsH
MSPTFGDDRWRQSGWSQHGEDQVSNGPAGDIRRYSQLARAMIMRWGMSDKVIDHSLRPMKAIPATPVVFFSLGRYQGHDRGKKHRPSRRVSRKSEKFLLKERRTPWSRFIEYETLTGCRDQARWRAVETLNRDDDDDGMDIPPASGSLVTAILKTKPRKPKGSGDMGPGAVMQTHGVL